MSKCRFLATLSCFLLFSADCFGSTSADFKALFKDRDACVLIVDIAIGKITEEYNKKRCAERFSPNSTFKVAAALMAFERGILKDDQQVVKWDGSKHERAELNRDQTPYTWMSNSVVWVTQWITLQLGPKTVQGFLDSFSYGNKDFSGGITKAWLESTLKISAYEQMSFILKLWKGQLPVSKRTMDLTKEIIFIKKLGNASELYGKTGTGCLDDPGCTIKPGRMSGYFVGVLKSGDKEQAIVANASDLIAQKRPAGPRLRDTVLEFLKR